MEVIFPSTNLRLETAWIVADGASSRSSASCRCTCSEGALDVTRRNLGADANELTTCANASAHCAAGTSASDCPAAQAKGASCSRDVGVIDTDTCWYLCGAVVAEGGQY